MLRVFQQILTDKEADKRTAINPRWVLVVEPGPNGTAYIAMPFRETIKIVQVEGDFETTVNALNCSLLDDCFGD